MPTLSEELHKAIPRVKNQAGLLQLLRDTLNWELPEGDASDLAYGWTPDDLRAQSLEAKLLNGQVWQFQLKSGQPWGLFLVEFRDAKAYRSVLRKVLRGLVPSRRRESNLPAWKHDNLLFLCTTKDYDRFTFAHFRGETAATARLATFGWAAGELHLRTLCEHNLPKLEWPKNPTDSDAWLKQWAAAFDVEAVTKSFFKEYREVFELVESKATDVPKGELRRLYTQRLFNRLLFLYFIERKHWLKFQGDEHYGSSEKFCNTTAKEDTSK